MVDDILPPAPPGAERGSSAKKAGLFSRLFKKRSVEQDVIYSQGSLPDEPPKIESTPEDLGVEEPGKINSETLDDIRKQLGLEAKVEIPEPPSVEPEKAPEPEEEFFNPIKEEKREEKQSVPLAGKIDFTQDVEKPPKIADKDYKAPEKVTDKTPKASKSVSAGTWDSDVKTDEPAKKSNFDIDVPAKAEQEGSKPKKEFLKEIDEHEVKALAKNIERKAFEDKKKIKYEPEVMFEKYFGKPKEGGEEDEKFDEEEKPEPKRKLSKKELKALKLKELKEKKAEKALKLKQLKEEKKKQLLMKKEADKAGKAAPSVGKTHDFTAEPVITKPTDEEKMKPELELKGPEPEKLLPAPAIMAPAVEEEPMPAPESTPSPSADIKKLKEKLRKEVVDEVRNEFRGKVKDKIREEVREEEKAALRKEYYKKDKELEAMKEALTKERQAFEQEKITAAGLENKYSFKEKQLRKEKELFSEEQAMFKNERKRFAEEKEEADNIHKKLLLMRKDYDKLSHKMVAFGEQIKLHMKVEENLNRREAELAMAQKRLEETEARIKEQGFADYLQTELKGQSITTISNKLEEGDVLQEKHLAIYNMIDECKSLVFQKRIDDAKAAYMRLRDEYKKGKFREEEKDQLYTTIRELYDDINLAAIERS